MVKASELRNKITKILASESANILPNLCVRYGLDGGDTSEAFKSKGLYVDKRLASKDNDFIIEMARKMAEDYDFELFDSSMVIAREGTNNTEVFISHLTVDKDYAEVVSKMLVDIGIPIDNVFCSSIPGQSIPLGQGFPEKIKSSILSSKLVIFIFSESFYNSVYCTNEMGAAWVLDKNIIPILIPPMISENMKGFIDKTRYQAGFINKGKDLNEFYNKVIDIFKIGHLKANQWENIKKDALDKVETVMNNGLPSNPTVAISDNTLPIKQLILSDRFSTNEIVLLAYIFDTGNRGFGYRWMADESIANIRSWEKQRCILHGLSQNYSGVIDNFAERGLLKPTEYTSYNNVRKYVMPIEIYDEVHAFDDDTIEKITKVLDNLEVMR